MPFKPSSNPFDVWKNVFVIRFSAAASCGPSSAVCRIINTILSALSEVLLPPVGLLELKNLQHHFMTSTWFQRMVTIQSLGQVYVKLSNAMNRWGFSWYNKERWFRYCFFSAALPLYAYRINLLTFSTFHPCCWGGNLVRFRFHLALLLADNIGSSPSQVDFQCIGIPRVQWLYWRFYFSPL